MPLGVGELIDHLGRKLLERHPDWRFQTTATTSIVFPAKNPAIGEAEVREHGAELILRLGRFTHQHYGNYDASIPPDEASDRITDSLVNFLEALFNDQIVLWGSHGEGGGSSIRSSARP